MTGYGRDGAELLDDVHGFLRVYVAFPSEAASVAVTLWAVHTHLVDRFESTPRLAVLSPEKRSGKSRLLELLDLLCAGAETLSDASPAYLFRRFGAGPVTALLDEADAIWKRGKADESAEALRSIINAGHRRSATVGRVEMNGSNAALRRFRVYAPAALAGIGDCLPDTILDRSVVVPMRRRAPDEPVAEYRERTTRPEGEALHDRVTAWAEAVADRVGDPWPRLPPGVTDRAADNWEPLLTVAALAGRDWPSRAELACVAFVTGSRDDTASLGVRLLADLHAVFGDAPALATRTILDRLCALDESPWGDWHGHPLTDRDLARLLRPFGVRSVKIRLGEITARGYRREDLHDPWTRYLAPGVSGTSGTSGTCLTSNVPHVPDVPDTPAGPEELLVDVLGARPLDQETSP